MPLHTPFQLGPFTVDDEGRVAPRDADAFPAFNVSWRGRTVRAHMTQGELPAGRLKLQAILGRVPSTRSGDSSGLRPHSFAALRAVQRDLPRDWEMRLMPNHSALLEAETNIELPITSVGLVTELTRFLLTLSPYLDLLDESGVTGAAAPSGTANT